MYKKNNSNHYFNDYCVYVNTNYKFGSCVTGCYFEQNSG